MVGLVADGLRRGVDGVGPATGCTERLGEGDAASPVRRRGTDGLPSSGNGFLMPAEATQGFTSQSVRPRPVPAERHRTVHGDQGSSRVATVQQRGGQPAPDLWAAGMGFGGAAQQGNRFATPAGGTQLGCSIEYVSERFAHRLCPPTSRTRQLGQVWQRTAGNEGTVLYRRVA
ncbi:MAG TPA: hypothetical protein VL652_18440 [Kutzneria sp.]|nr:hypothetical protein [Kutzneria sp.]